MKNKRYYVTPEEYEIAENNGISRKNVYNRTYMLGWDIERAITEKIHHRKKGYKKLVENSNSNVKYETFITRVNKGLSIEEALNNKVLSKEEVSELMIQSRCTVFTREEIARAKKNGICYRTLHWRVQKGKWDKEKAITTPLLSSDETMKRAREKSPFYQNRKEYFYKTVFNKKYKAQ